MSRFGRWSPRASDFKERMLHFGERDTGLCFRTCPKCLSGHGAKVAMSAINLTQLGLGFSGKIADQPPQQRSPHLQSHLFIRWKRASRKKNSRDRGLLQRPGLQQGLEIGCDQRGFLQLLAGGADCLSGFGELEHGCWIQGTSRWSLVASRSRALDNDYRLTTNDGPKQLIHKDISV